MKKKNKKKLKIKMLLKYNNNFDTKFFKENSKRWLLNNNITTNPYFEHFNNDNYRQLNNHMKNIIKTDFYYDSITQQPSFINQCNLAKKFIHGTKQNKYNGLKKKFNNVINSIKNRFNINTTHAPKKQYDKILQPVFNHHIINSACTFQPKYNRNTCILINNDLLKSNERIQIIFKLLSKLYNSIYNRMIILYSQQCKQKQQQQHHIKAKEFYNNKQKLIKKHKNKLTKAEYKKLKNNQKRKYKQYIKKIKNNYHIKFSKRFKCNIFNADDKANMTLIRELKNVSNLSPYENSIKEHLKRLKFATVDRTLDKAYDSLVSIIKQQKTKDKYFFNLTLRTRKNNPIFFFNQRDYKVKNVKALFTDLQLPAPESEFYFIYKRDKKKWYLNYNVEYNLKASINNNVNQPKTIVGSDPGVRKWFTTYQLNDNSYQQHQLSDNLKKKIKANSKLQRQLNYLVSYTKNLKNRDVEEDEYYYSLQYLFTPGYVNIGYKVHDENCFLKLKKVRIAKARMQSKVSTLLKDAQYKMAHWFCDDNDLVVYPSFKVSEMIKKKEKRRRRKIQKKTVKDLLTSSFGMFKERLKEVAEKTDTVIINSYEPYTSNTCRDCKRMTITGSKETFTCRYQDCGLVCDRDENSAFLNTIVMFI